MDWSNVARLMNGIDNRLHVHKRASAVAGCVRRASPGSPGDRD